MSAVTGVQNLVKQWNILGEFENWPHEQVSLYAVCLLITVPLLLRCKIMARWRGSDEGQSRGR